MLSFEFIGEDIGDDGFIINFSFEFRSGRN